MEGGGGKRLLASLWIAFHEALSAQVQLASGRVDVPKSTCPRCQEECKDSNGTAVRCNLGVLRLLWAIRVLGRVWRYFYALPGVFGRTGTGLCFLGKNDVL